MKKLNDIIPTNPSSELVDSIVLKRYSSGILQFMINTKSKWLYYYPKIPGIIELYNDIGEMEIIEIKDNRLEGDFVTFDLQNKDQISIYYIPKNLLGIDGNSIEVSTYIYNDLEK